MAKQSIQLTVTQRAELGSRANKRLRDGGALPGVVYGHKLEVLPITLPKKQTVTSLERGAHLFELNIDGRNETVLVKDVQYDHLGIEVIHVDFARVSLDERVEVTVPLELRGTPAGEADGGVLQQIISELEVECLVTDIPESIRHNVANMGLDSVLHVRDLKLPDGVKCLLDPDQLVATVKEITEEEPEAVAAEGEVAEPEVIGRKAEESEAPEADAKK